MCDSPISCWLASFPKIEFGNFYVITKQYHERVQMTKEYLIFDSARNRHLLAKFNKIKEVFIPCGKCIQCCMSRSKSWEIRSILEKNLFKDCCCLTLTYDDEHLPKCDNYYKDETGTYEIPDDQRGIIFYKDVQDFIKRIRKHFNFKRTIRYICSCEYGTTGTLRPHYHIILFNYTPDDIDPNNVRRSKKGTLLYKSKFLTEKWSKGFVDVGKCDNQACRYIAQYCCKKLLHQTLCKSAKDINTLNIKNKIQREGLHASLGLGLQGFKDNYHTFIYQNFIQYGKFKYAIPRYFVKKLEAICPRLYNEFKKKSHEFFLNYKVDFDELRRLRARSNNIISKLKLFMGDLTNCLVS